MCLSTISSNAAFANPDNLQLRTMPSIEVEIESHLTQKHIEIDQYVFKENFKEIQGRGFTITHTGPMEGYIEIGITPYSEEHAEYLYEIFGRDSVKVVEGQQAYTLELRQTVTDIELDKIALEPSVENKVIMDKGIRVLVNDELVKTDIAPFVENSRTLIPLRGVMEKLGATVEWDPRQQAISVDAEDMNIRLIIGQDTAKVTKSVDGVQSIENLKLEVPAKIVEGRTFIPGRFVAETLGAVVGWDNSNRVVTIETVGSRGNIGIEKPISPQPNELNQEEIGESLETMGKAISVDTIKEMKLFSLMAEEIKTFEQDEMIDLIHHLNSSPTYNGAYPMMLAGNSIMITLEDGSNIHMTSYGFEEHVLVGGQIGDEHIYYCIVSPEIGKILLSIIE